MARKTPVKYSESFRAALLAGLMLRPHPDVRSAKGIRQSTPVVGRIDSWGPKFDSGSWDYTKRPAESRYKYGSANGGMMFLPPEYHADLADNAFTGLTASTTYYAVAGGASWGAGTPLRSTGLLADGYSWKQVTSHLDFFTHTSAGVAANAIRFTSGGGIGFRNGTAYWGTLAHANTADRTYTFPDSDGTIALAADIPAYNPMTDPFLLALHGEAN